jgi:CSLREA domain-containing protein
VRARGIALAAMTALVWVGAAASVPRTAAAAPTVTVDSFEDAFDGACSDGDCTLRDAIASVDAGGVVRVPAGFYALSLGGAGGIGRGDLDLVRPITIVGVGRTGAFLDASSLGARTFDVAATVRLERLALLGGSSEGAGGIVRVRSGATRIAGVTLVGGTARDGGAVAVGGGAAVRITRSWIAANAASGRGGALFVVGRAAVSRSTLSDNAAAVGGGAWVDAAGSFEVADSTVSGNRADARGGGVHVGGGATIRSSTIARNRSAVGGAIAASAGAVVDLGSSILDGNAARVRGPACSRPVVSSGHNVADRTGCGLDGPGDRAGVDPSTGALRQNGGPTPTHAVWSRSPAIGNGGDCSRLDQRGAPRRRCDSGAYELVRCLGRPVTVVGTGGDDDLSGGLGRDVFLGRNGDDVFQGSVGRDRACGGRGRDELIAGPDDDRFAGNAGDDELHGESGDDRLRGGAGSDALSGGPGRDVCRGGAGPDRVRGCEA